MGDEQETDWRMVRLDRDLSSLTNKVDSLQATVVTMQLHMQQSFISREEYERRHKEMQDDVKAARRLLDRGTYLLVATLVAGLANLALRLT